MVRAVERVMPAVVNIRTETVMEIRDPFSELFRDFWNPYHGQPRRDVRHSLGSGVIIDPEGYLLTNDHVVRRATRIQVRLSDGRELEAERVAYNQRADLALLKLKAKPGTRFKTVPFARDDDLLLGETVLALGNPFGLGGSVWTSDIERGADLAAFEYWVLARLGARRLFHAPEETIIPPDDAASWLSALLEIPADGVADHMRLFAITRVAAGTGVRRLDIDRDLAARITDHLASADCPRHWIDFLEPRTLETAEDQARILGDTLPLGLTILD